MQNHLELLCDFSELNWVFNESQNIARFFDKLVAMVAGHMQTTVCSLYLYDKEQRELRLQATHGLNEAAVGLVRLREGEGLTGKALSENKSIVTGKASIHPAYKYFGGVDEELYDAFMAVPILRGINKIGVLVLQREEDKPFSPAEVTVTQTIASQLANIIESARLLTNFKESSSAEVEKAALNLSLVHGKSASEGLVQGGAVVLRRYQDLSDYLESIPVSELTLNDFKSSLAKTEIQLEAIQKEVEEQLSDVASLIFSAHLLMLKDSSLTAKIENLIVAGSSPGAAVVEVANYYIDRFSKVEDHYIREKADDVRDLAMRLLRNLSPPEDDISELSAKVIIADQLLPSDILKLSHEKIAGIVLVSGGVTSHVALLARSLGVPLVIADEPRLLEIPGDSLVLLDATTGNLYINPEPAVLAVFAKKKQSHGVFDEVALNEPTRTRDGTRITLYSNINLLSDLKTASRYGAEGVGLYRSEIPFLVRSDFPSEEEQFLVYERLAAGMPEKPIVFRTLDIGGDKVLSYYHHDKEENPFMGMRSIRFSLLHKDIFARQLRAVLRACAHSDLRIMFPMIASWEEFVEARQVLFDCQRELKAEGRDFCRNPQIGIMVEIPSVVDIIDSLALEADFFSIGTNDLIQYLLAVDRTNEKVAPFYIPHHPAVLRTLKRIMQSAAEYDVPVSLCGDMACREIYLPFLLGIGVRNLSVDPSYLPRIKKACSEIDLCEAGKVAQKLLTLSSIKAIEELL